MHMGPYDGDNPLRFPQKTLGYLELTIEANGERISPCFVESGKWASHNPICEACEKRISYNLLATLVN